MDNAFLVPVLEYFSRSVNEFTPVVNNHRVMLRNAQLRDHAVHNLSKFASAKGLREGLSFKIGYDVPANRIKRMFEESFEAAVADPDVMIEGQYPLEIRVTDAVSVQARGEAG